MKIVRHGFLFLFAIRLKNVWYQQLGRQKQKGLRSKRGISTHWLIVVGEKQKQ